MLFVVVSVIYNNHIVLCVLCVVCVIYTHIDVLMCMMSEYERDCCLKQCCCVSLVFDDNNSLC